MGVHICHPSIWEAEEGELRAQGLPGLYSEMMSQEKKKRIQKKKIKHYKTKQI